jgi:5'-methylthioadenosine phosphorylase
MTRIGIIGGTGVDGFKLEAGQRFGQYQHGLMNGVEVIVANRHFYSAPLGEKAGPHKIPYDSLVDLFVRHGVDALISITACGSLRRHIEPGQFVLPTDYIDHTGRSFSTIRTAIHPSSLNPYNDGMQAVLREPFNCRKAKSTLISISGPRFATRAESEMYRAWGADLVNMTTATETALLAEQGIPHVVLAYVTDYDSCVGSPEVTSMDLIHKRFEEANKALARHLPEAIRSIHAGTVTRAA